MTTAGVGVPSAPRRVLIAAQMGIGNAILFLPFLEALRRGFPQAQLVAVFSEPNGSEDVLRELAPHLVDEVVQLDVRGRSQLRRVFAGIRLGLRRFDLAIFRFSGYRAEVIVAAFIGRARWRLGHATSSDWVNRWDAILNIPVVMRENSHEVDRYLQLAERLGLETPVRLPRIVPPPVARQRAARYYPTLFQEAFRWVALAPGSSADQAWKRWPHAAWVELTRQLVNEGICPVFFGSPSEASMTASIICDAGADKVAINTAGTMSLAETSAALAGASALVCCDSALMHLAAAVGTQVIAIFGPTDECRTGPLGSGHLLLRSSGCRGACYSLRNPRGHAACDVARCMREVSADVVMDAVRHRVRP